MSSYSRLQQNFFARSTLQVAEELLGKTLVFDKFRGVITETEAYTGPDDPACHAYRGITPRSRVMFGPPGRSYVYLIYGMYHCFNIVTESDGFPAAVLIRGLYLTEPYHKNLDGPGKLCRELQITRQHNDLDITTSPTFCIEDSPSITSFKLTPRIGISQGIDKLWRYIVDVKALSK